MNTKIFKISKLFISKPTSINRTTFQPIINSHYQPKFLNQTKNTQMYKIAHHTRTSNTLLTNNYNYNIIFENAFKKSMLNTQYFRTLHTSNIKLSKKQYNFKKTNKWSCSDNKNNKIIPIIKDTSNNTKQTKENEVNIPLEISTFLVLSTSYYILLSINSMMEVFNGHPLLNICNLFAIWFGAIICVCRLCDNKQSYNSYIYTQIKLIMIIVLILMYIYIENNIEITVQKKVSSV